MWLAGGIFAALAAVAAIAAVALHRAEPFVRARIVATLQDRFHARVELDGFHLSLLHGLQAEGRGLRIWPPANVAGVAVPKAPDGGAQSQGEPLIRIEEFHFHAPLTYRSGQPFRIAEVDLKGLQVHLPPRSHFTHLPLAEEKDKTGRIAGFPSIAIDRIEAADASLTLGTDKPGKLPLAFAIASLKLTGVAADGSMSYEAELTNPRPVGKIHAAGRFGPWQTADPGESQIAGDYRFEHADLSGFKGIAGILDSTGHFQGTLRNLLVDGKADVPDFRLSHFGNPLPLRTRFHAKVDATDGDTWLEPVDATLGRSHFTAEGGIVRVLAPVSAGETGPPHSIGHDIALNVRVDRARIEDFLRLASHSPTPLLTGALALKTRLHIAPGSAPVHERLVLDGSFTLDQVRFASPKIQDRIEELSLRGQGRPNDLKSTDPASVLSRMQGDFHMSGGVVALPALDYTVPGADSQLKGTYGLEGGALNFVGTAKMQATVSKMVGGWKGLLLSPLDGLFKKKGAGTVVPIHIDGTREQPKFGIDFDRMK
jgi:hypothetical protein